MTTAREFWRPIISDFNPVGQPRPDDVRRFFVDRSAGDPARSIVQMLTLNLENNAGGPRPYRGLVTGHVGSGKTSELLRLGTELGEQFFVVVFDAETTLDLETANHFELLLGMGFAVHAAAQVAGLNPAKKPADALVKSLAKFVRKYEERKGFSLNVEQVLKHVFAFVVIGGAAAAGGPPAAVAAGAAVIGANEIFKATRLELNVKDELVKTLELPPNRQEVVGALNAIIDDVRTRAGRPVLIITDGLDKVSALRARKLFAESALLTEPACALVYAAPIEFYHRLSAGQATNVFDDYLMLPNLIVHGRPAHGEHWKDKRAANDTGIAVLRTLVERRLAPRGLTIDEVIAPAALVTLGRASGGVTREFVRAMRDAMRVAQIRSVSIIDAGIANGVVGRQSQDVASRLTAQHREAIERVLRQGALSGAAHEAAEDDLLRNLHLLSYHLDDHFWFDAHPSVLALV